jgi:uncharacterized protein YfkK (UPF0435 family)
LKENIEEISKKLEAVNYELAMNRRAGSGSKQLEQAQENLQNKIKQIKSTIALPNSYQQKL